MTKYDQILAIAKEHNGVFTGEMAKKAGIPSVYISNLSKKGQITKIAPGIYGTCDCDWDTMYFLNLQYPRAIFSFESALWLNGLSETILDTCEITFPKGYNPHRIKNHNTNVHFSSKQYYSIGQITLMTIFGNLVTCYDAERTLCDLVRNRESIDCEMFRYAFKTYKHKPGRDFFKLREYAEIFHILPEMERILEIL